MNLRITKGGGDRPMETLAEAREYVRNRLSKGVICPCCDRFSRAYRRPLNKGMATSLIRMYQIRGRGWINVPKELKEQAGSREEGKLAYWGLIEESAEVREDGGRAGWWRVTEQGERFVKGSKVLKYVLLNNRGEVKGFDGPMVAIEDCLKRPFDYRELMDS